MFWQGFGASEEWEPKCMTLPNGSVVCTSHRPLEITREQWEAETGRKRDEGWEELPEEYKPFRPKPDVMATRQENIYGYPGVAESDPFPDKRVYDPFHEIMTGTTYKDETPKLPDLDLNLPGLPDLDIPYGRIAMAIIIIILVVMIAVIIGVKVRLL